MFFGDPHFFTFDGASTLYNHKTGPVPIHMWVVQSSEIHIQAINGKFGFVRGIAFGGPFLQGHTLMMLNQNVTWDGKPILEKMGDTFKETGLASLSRVPKNQWFKTDPDFFDNVYNNTRVQRQRFNEDKKWWTYGADGPNLGAMRFKLPYDVEGWITSVNRGMQLLLKMPSQPGQCGYCGNFDGNASNDESPEKVRFWLGARKAAGCGLDAIEKEEDLFDQAGLSQSVHVALPSTSSLAPEKSCSQEMMRKARAACQHIPQDNIKDSCEMDVCLTGDAGNAKAATLMHTMHIAFAGGTVQFAGPGECKDRTGESYTTLDLETVSDETNCLNLGRKLSRDTKLVEQGIEGVQFNNKAKTCQVVLEAGGTYGHNFIVKLPGLWGNLQKRSGAGIVSKVTKMDGWSCWKIV